MYLCWEIGAIDLMITIDDVFGWFIWTQNWNSGMEPINLTILWGRWWCFLILTLVSFVGAVYLCNMEILFFCMLQPKSYVFLGCSGRIFSTDILSVDHPKKSVFVPKPLYFNLLIYFVSTCAIHCLFFCGGCLFCWNSGVTVFPEGCFRQPSKPWRSGKVLTEEYLEPWPWTMQGMRDQNYVL